MSRIPSTTVIACTLLAIASCRGVEHGLDPQKLGVREPGAQKPGAQSNTLTPDSAPRASVPAVVTEPPRTMTNDEIVICGRRVHTGAPVVLWTESPEYDASKSEPRFSAPRADGKGPSGLRYQPGRVRKLPNPQYIAPPLSGDRDVRTDLERQETLTEVLVPPDSHEFDLLANVVDQFVLHFDVCGLSRTCFRVLQDERGLSVHFLLDIDGTIYQTLDVRDTAWHATKANPRSVGIEMANMGAYSARESFRLDDWYQRDAIGTYIRIPPRVKETGLRTLGFVGRPARNEKVLGSIQGDALQQYDFTPEQYASLVKLAAVLCTELPKIAPDAPRDENGSVPRRVLDDGDWQAFHGILGHYHVQKNKNDPGPAFDWERFLEGVRARMSEMRATTH